MAKILNTIVFEGADYEIITFTIGKTNTQPSVLVIDLICTSEQQMEHVQKKLLQTGCYENSVPEAVFKVCEKDRCAPDDFYSTTNLKTELFYHKTWHLIRNQRMDAVIVSVADGFVCKKLRDLKTGDLVLCSAESVKINPSERERESSAFGFMNSDVSSEKSVEIMVIKLAEELKRIKARNGKIVVVAGPVVIHTGGAGTFAYLVREGYVHGLLSGNALAVHDMEVAFYHTSLGIDLRTGWAAPGGHKNHLNVINRIYRHGSMHAAVGAGDLKSGIMYEIIKKNIPYCLAGSIRDDGPLPETVTDMIRAQQCYAEIVQDAAVVIMLSSMLHSIGTGNMLPSWVKTVCVDINPAVVTKLSDRGSSQVVGIVSDVGFFLQALVNKL